MSPRTLYDKIWDEHLVATRADGTSLLYIDRHLVHEVTSPQAFEGLRMAGRKVRRPEATLAVADMVKHLKGEFQPFHQCDWGHARAVSLAR